MSCERAGQIDADAFLLDSGAVEFEAFRAHFPGCRECSAAVARWTAFDLALRDVLAVDGEGAMAHPSPDRLEAFLASRQTMGEEAMRIENHLASCPSCQTELRVLGRFEDEFLAVVTDDSNRREARGAGLFDRLRRLLEESRFEFGLALPALAILFLAVFGLWWSGLLERGGSRSPSVAPPQIVQQEGAGGPASGEPDSPSRVLPGEAGEERERIVERVAPEAEGVRARPGESPGPEPVELAEAQPAQSPVPAPTRIVAPKPEAEAPTDAAPRATEPESGPREEILLAALSDLPLPSYTPPAGAESLGWLRQFSAVRAGPAVASIETRAPTNHVGLSLSASPRLWWSLSADTDLPVQVTIVDGREEDLVLRVDLPGPHAAGLHAIDLAEQGVSLEPDVDYRWFVALLVDVDRPSRNPVSAAALRRIPESDNRHEAAALSSPAERGHTLARLGLWYDAFDFFASIAASHPDFAPVARYRERLVELARSNP